MTVVIDSDDYRAAGIAVILFAMVVACCDSQVRAAELHIDVGHAGKLVSGLHVENNLRIIPALENRRKHNHWNGE